MQKNKSKKDFYDRLRSIAWDLNQLRDEHPAGMKAWTDAWAKAESIVQTIAGEVPTEPGNTVLGTRNAPPMLKWGISSYNRIFEEVPVRLGIALPKDSTRPLPTIFPMSETKKPLALLGIKLWLDYFNNPSRDRLKQCWQCKVWFVDTTKNGLKHFCMPSCSRKWWNRPFRREWKKISEDLKVKGRFRQSPLTREAAVAVLGRLKSKKEKGKRPSR